MLRFDPPAMIGLLTPAQAELFHLVAMVAFGSGVDLVITHAAGSVAIHAGQPEGVWQCEITVRWQDQPFLGTLYRWLDGCLSRQWSVHLLNDRVCVRHVFERVPGPPLAAAGAPPAGPNPAPDA